MTLGRKARLGALIALNGTPPTADFANDRPGRSEETLEFEVLSIKCKRATLPDTV
jgi:hypothetical protein